MTKIGFGVSVGLAALIALATASSAGAADGTVALPPGGPVPTFPQDQTVGGANPFVPFGTDPFVPYGVWTP